MLTLISQHVNLTTSAGYSNCRALLNCKILLRFLLFSMSSEDEANANFSTSDYEDYDENLDPASLSVGTNFDTRSFNLHQLGASSGFFIEIDSLIAYFSRDGKMGIDWSFGGQLVHLIWSVENLLSLLSERGALFYFVAVESCSAIHSGNPSLLLARKVLLTHLLNNVDSSVFILNDSEEHSLDYFSANIIENRSFKGNWKGTLMQLFGFKSPSFVLLSIQNLAFASKCTQLNITTAFLEGSMCYTRTMNFNTLSVRNALPNQKVTSKSCEPLETPRFDNSLDMSLRVKMSIIALYNFYKNIKHDHDKLMFVQLYLLHLISLETVSFEARSHVLPKICKFLEFSELSLTFKNCWTEMQTMLIHVLNTFLPESHNDTSLIDLQDSRTFWKLVLIFYTNSVKTSFTQPVSFVEFFDVPSDASKTFTNLWAMLEIGEDEVLWPPEYDHQPISMLLDSLSKTGTEFVPELYDIKLDTELEVVEPIKALIPCTSLLVDEIRMQYNTEPDICYKIVTEKEVDFEIGGDVVYDDWENAFSCDEDTALEVDVTRGNKPHLISQNEPILSKINFIDFDMELFWFAYSRNFNFFKKRSKNEILTKRAQTYQSLCNILEKNSASLNLTGLKKISGFSLIKSTPMLPKEETKQTQNLPKKKKGKPGSKKSLLLANEAKLILKLKIKEENDQKNILDNIKNRFTEIGSDFTYLWNLLWTKFTIPKYIVEIRIWFMLLMKTEWVGICRSTQGKTVLDDDSYPVMIYRLAADTWFEYPGIISSDVKYQNSITSCFDCLGFFSVSRQFRESFSLFNSNPDPYLYKISNLQVTPLELTKYSSNTPQASDYSKLSDVMMRVHVGMSPVSFQMLHMGHLMDRSTFSKKDPRVSFFPDDWQIHLLNLIDEGTSVLVCAPTSSGKTFASFYMIEKILHESEDGIAVCVCPTKALVNQAEADIYARFKNFELKEGQRLVGPCLREYRTGSYEAGLEEDGKEPYEGRYMIRVLVTVPSCLEQLLFSVTGKIRPNIRGVIFDEIHCLNESSESGGLIWESMLGMVTCPFLALSATIGNMENFAEWLQSMREKVGKMELIHVKERFSDLRLSSWIPNIPNNPKSNSLIQINPISFLLDQYCSKEMFDLPQTMSHKASLIDLLNLTAFESMQLYKQLYAVSQREPMKSTAWAEKLNEVEPEKLFSNYICITQSMQRQWSKKLLALLKELAMDSSHYEVDRVARNLINYSYSDFPPMESTEKEIVNLVAELRSKSKLPALVFCFSSAVCRKLAESLLEAFDGDDYDYDDPDSNERFAPLVKQGQIYSELEMNELIANLRKKNLRVPKSYFRCLKHGIGIHYSGLDKKFLLEIERLFREKHLQVVVSTNTLALGVNMPCRSVIFAHDSPELNSVQYRQMSGRAGRRGYDYIGDVVFCGIGVLKIQRLFFSKIPPLVGSFPINSLKVLKMANLFNIASPKEVENIKIGLVNLTSKTLYAWDRPDVRQQLWYHFRYTLEHLWNEYLLDLNGKPVNLAGTITNLSHLESFSLLLNSFILNPNLETLAQQLSDQEIELQIVNILSRFVAKPYTYQEIKQVVGKKLENLHPKLSSVLDIHNRRALNQCSKTLQAIVSSLNLGSEVLPFSKVSIGETSPKVDKLWSVLYEDAIKFKARSKFVATSGLGDFFKNCSDICFTIRNDVPLVPEAVPTLVSHDMSGNELYYTNHMLDFYSNNAELTLPKYNVLSSYNIHDDTFYDQLKLLTETIESIYMILDKTVPNSRITQVMKNLTSAILVKFANSYPQSKKNLNKLKDLKLETTEEEKLLKQKSEKFIRKYKKPKPGEVQETE